MQNFCENGGFLFTSGAVLPKNLLEKKTEFA